MLHSLFFFYFLLSLQTVLVCLLGFEALQVSLYFSDWILFYFLEILITAILSRLPKTRNIFLIFLLVCATFIAALRAAHFYEFGYSGGTRVLQDAFSAVFESDSLRLYGDVLSSGIFFYLFVCALTAVLYSARRFCLPRSILKTYQLHWFVSALLLLFVFFSESSTPPVHSILAESVRLLVPERNLEHLSHHIPIKSLLKETTGVNARKDLMTPAAQYPKRIVFLEMESVSAVYWRELSRYGQLSSRAFQRLAKKGCVYPRHYSTSGSSTDADFSILTGLYPSGNSSYTVSPYQYSPYYSMLHFLKQQGYQNYVYSDHSINPWQYYKLFGKDLVDEFFVPSSAELGELDRRKFAVNAFIENVNKSAVKDEDSFHYFRFAYPHAPLSSAEGNTTQEKYFNELREVDRVLNQILDFFYEQNLLAGSVVFVFADHGFALGQHAGVRAHGSHVFDESSRVPFAILGVDCMNADFPIGTSHVDVFPTVLGLFGQSDPELEGYDLQKSIPEERVVYFMSGAESVFRAVLRWPFKLIVKLNAEKRALYDLTTDPEEENDIFDPQSEVAQTLSAVFDSLTQHLRKGIGSSRLHSTHRPSVADLLIDGGRIEQVLLNGTLLSGGVDQSMRGMQKKLPLREGTNDLQVSLVSRRKSASQPVAISIMQFGRVIDVGPGWEVHLNGNSTIEMHAIEEAGWQPLVEQEGLLSIFKRANPYKARMGIVLGQSERVRLKVRFEVRDGVILSKAYRASCHCKIVLHSSTRANILESKREMNLNLPSNYQFPKDTYFSFTPYGTSMPLVFRKFQSRSPASPGNIRWRHRRLSESLDAADSDRRWVFRESASNAPLVKYLKKGEVLDLAGVR